MKRRDFLRQMALGAVFGGLSPEWVWASPAVPHNDQPLQRLIVVFLRGGIDGLNVVIPYQEDNYYALRPTVAIPAPGKPDGAIKLDDQFALHPALAALQPFWQDKSLAFVHAGGVFDGIRSHFSAQATVESGLSGSSTSADGWMNRLLGQLQGDVYPTRAVSFGPSTLPLILSGSQPAATQAFGPVARRVQPSETPVIAEVFDKLYSAQDDLGKAYREGKMAHQRLMADLRQDMKAADRDAPEPHHFMDETRKVAQLIRGESRVQLAFMALGGWDTHIAQGGVNGALAHKLRPLGEGLAQLIRGLDSDYAHTTLVVLSEFGRTVAENGNGGTDHGHGNVMWVMGGGVKGGKVYGKWPGLEPEALFERRDLNVTTDYREVLWWAAQQRFGFKPEALARILPGFTPSRLFT
ncbi:MAG: DUF1501 domain-containing protein [Methylococcaceae bacterium]